MNGFGNNLDSAN